jgi:hypothetical protein
VKVDAPDDFRLGSRLLAASREQETALKIGVRPPQPQHLTPPHSGVGRQFVK